jgi:hypothetical protein
MLIDSDDDPISLSCENPSFIEENDSEIFNTITPVELTIKKRKIIRKENPKIVNRTLSFLEYYRTDVDLKSYKIVDLKAVASHNRLHISGNKTVLIERISTYFQRNMSALKIQSNLRLFFVKRSFQLRGPGYHDRSLCVNDTDFYSLEPLSEIPFQEFFSYKDEQSFVYGFNVCSLMALLVRKGRSILNPYNRAKIPEKVVGDMIRLYVYSVIFFPEHINDEDKCVRTRNVYIQSPNPILIARGYFYGFPCSQRYLNSLSRNRTETVIPDQTRSPFRTTSLPAELDVEGILPSDHTHSRFAESLLPAELVVGDVHSPDQNSVTHDAPRGTRISRRRRVGMFPRMLDNSPEEEDTRIGDMIDNILDVQNVETVTNTESDRDDVPTRDVNRRVGRDVGSVTEGRNLIRPSVVLSNVVDTSSEEWINRILNTPTNTWLNEMLAPSRNYLPVGWSEGGRAEPHDNFIFRDEERVWDQNTTLTNSVDISGSEAWFVNPIIQAQNTNDDFATPGIGRILRVNTHIRFTDEDVPPFEEFEDELPENPLRDDVPTRDVNSRFGVDRVLDNLEIRTDQHSLVATSGRRSPVATSGQRSPVATSGQRSPVATSGQRSQVFGRTHNPVQPIVSMETSEETMHIQTMENRMREIIQQPILVRTQELFMEIDQLGNYTNVDWFHQLNKRDCFVFFQFLHNHWRYRGQLSNAVKKRICPLGDPFLGITHIQMRMNEITEEQLRFNCITVMERLAYTAYDIEDRKLAVLYILAALTQVSLPARNNMVWLYESMNQ